MLRGFKLTFKLTSECWDAVFMDNFSQTSKNKTRVYYNVRASWMMTLHDRTLVCYILNEWVRVCGEWRSIHTSRPANRTLTWRKWLQLTQTNVSLKDPVEWRWLETSSWPNQVTTVVCFTVQKYGRKSERSLRTQKYCSLFCTKDANCVYMRKTDVGWHKYNNKLMMKTSLSIFGRT